MTGGMTWSCDFCDKLGTEAEGNEKLYTDYSHYSLWICYECIEEYGNKLP